MFRHGRDEASHHTPHTVVPRHAASSEVSESYSRARKVFTGLKGRGFGRLDVRSDLSGSQLQLLEINPNCGIFYPDPQGCSADEILSAAGAEGAPEGGHEVFAERLIACALGDHERRRTALRYHSLHRKGRGFGIFALRDIKEGELVQENEEKPTVWKHLADILFPVLSVNNFLPSKQHFSQSTDVQDDSYFRFYFYSVFVHTTNYHLHPRRKIF